MDHEVAICTPQFVSSKRMKQTHAKKMRDFEQLLLTVLFPQRRSQYQGYRGILRRENERLVVVAKRDISGLAETMLKWKNWVRICGNVGVLLTGT